MQHPTTKNSGITFPCRVGICTAQILRNIVQQKILAKNCSPSGDLYGTAPTQYILTENSRATMPAARGSVWHASYATSCSGKAKRREVICMVQLLRNIIQRKHIGQHCLPGGCAERFVRYEPLPNTIYRLHIVDYLDVGSGLPSICVSYYVRPVRAVNPLA